MDPVSLLPLIVIAALFWLLIIRPASKRQKDMQRMQSGLDVGDRVVLTSGIHGDVAALDDATVDVEVATGVVVTVARGAIGTVLPRDTDDDAVEGPLDDERPALDHDDSEERR